MQSQSDGDGDVLWSRVDEGFFVASRRGEFLGYIDRQAPEVFLVCDHHSRAVARAADLAAAMAALTSRAGMAR